MRTAWVGRRRRAANHVALGIGERSPAPSDLEREREAHVTAQFFGDVWSPFGHGALANKRGTDVSQAHRPPVCSVQRKASGGDSRCAKDAKPSLAFQLYSIS
jgi:hypothetical protein